MKKLITTLTLILITINLTDAQSWLWAKEPQGTARNSEVFGTAINNNGDVFVEGYYQTSCNIGTATTLSVNFPGDYQNFVAKYNSAGVPQWLRNIDPQQPDATSGMDISCDSLGNCYVSSGNGYVSSTPGSPFNYASSYGGFHQLRKINSAGATVWQVYPSFAASSACTFESMKTDGEGNTYITGPFQGNVTFGSITLSSPSVEDVFVVKYDPSGAVVYAVQGTLNGSTRGHGIDIDYAGNAVIVGEFQSSLTLGTFNLTSNGGLDYFIARLGPTGNFLWAKSDGSASHDALYGVAIDYPRIYVTGYFQANFTMGSLTVNTYGGQDIIVACTDISGNELWAKANGGSGISTNDDMGYDIVADHNGFVYASGNFLGPATFGSTSVTAGNNAAYLVKYDIIGTQLWVKKVTGGGIVVVSGKALAANRNNEEIMASCFTMYGGTIDFSGSTISLSCNGGPGNYGSAYYVAKIGNCSMATTASSSVTINCHDTTNLTASSSLGTGASTYTWSPAGSLVSATGATVQAHPVTTTTYTVTGTDGLGCSATSTVTVTVTGFPVVVVSGTTSICAGASTTLTGLGASTYVWTPSTGLSTTTAASTVATPTSTTTYTVTGTDTYGCANTYSVTVTVNPLPGVPTISQALNVLISSTAVGYQWYLNGSPISGATNQNYTMISNGIYTVTITDLNGCTATSAPLLITTVGIAELSADNYITVSPNPMTDEADVFLNSSNTLEHPHLRIVDVLGRIIADEQFAPNHILFKKKSLTSGIYFYSLLDAERVITTGKLVIK